MILFSLLAKGMKPIKINAVRHDFDDMKIVKNF
jgi:hypothetical protein